jgi:hypothetical protein
MTLMAALAAASLFALAGCKQTSVGGNEAATNGSENAAAPAVAAGSIDGTWVADTDSVQFDQKPDEYLLQGGQYSCKSCDVPYTVAADGAFHPVSLPYADSMAVKVIDDHTVQRTAKKGGRQVGETKMTVSGDGNTLTGSFTDTSVANAPPGKGEFTETRVGPAPTGAHAVSGQWKPAKLANFNAEQLTTTYKLDGDTLHMTSPSGYSYDAKLGGPDVPIKGDISGASASVMKLPDGSYQETDKRAGKVINVTTFTVGSDGKLHVVGEDKMNGSKITYTATKK